MAGRPVPWFWIPDQRRGELSLRIKQRSKSKLLDVAGVSNLSFKWLQATSSDFKWLQATSSDQTPQSVTCADHHSPRYNPAWWRCKAQCGRIDHQERGEGVYSWTWSIWWWAHKSRKLKKWDHQCVNNNWDYHHVSITIDILNNWVAKIYPNNMSICDCQLGSSQIGWGK